LYSTVVSYKRVMMQHGLWLRRAGFNMSILCIKTFNYKFFEGLSYGDQFGRFFAYWASYSLLREVFLKKQTDVTHIFGLLLPRDKCTYLYVNYALILTKMSWATFWQFFHKLIWPPRSRRECSFNLYISERIVL
jgi:hypothetical protein